MDQICSRRSRRGQATEREGRLQILNTHSKSPERGTSSCVAPGFNPGRAYETNGRRELRDGIFFTFGTSDNGFDAASMAPPNNCKAGLCLPVPTGPEAGLWSDVPISLWVGPAELAPQTCPDDPFSGVPNLKFRPSRNQIASADKMVMRTR